MILNLCLSQLNVSTDTSLALSHLPFNRPAKHFLTQTVANLTNIVANSSTDGIKPCPVLPSGEKDLITERLIILMIICEKLKD